MAMGRDHAGRRSFNFINDLKKAALSDANRAWNNEETICRLLRKAGLQPGQRILDLGGALARINRLRGELEAFQVLSLEEQLSKPVKAKLHVVGISRNFHFMVDAVRNFDLPGAFFDAILALDFWPEKNLSATIELWRRLLSSGSGIVIVGGIDMATGTHQRDYPSEQWLTALRSAGFKIDVVVYSLEVTGRYEHVASSARLASSSLRSALGAAPASSYLNHIDRLHRITHEEPMYRFAIVARLPDAVTRPPDLSLS